MYMYNYIEMARVTGVPMSFLLTRGQSIKVFSQILRKSRQRNLLVPNMKVCSCPEVVIPQAWLVDIIYRDHDESKRVIVIRQVLDSSRSRYKVSGSRTSKQFITGELGSLAGQVHARTKLNEAVRELQIFPFWL